MPPTDRHEMLVLAADVLTVALLTYLLWTYLPDAVRQEVRAGFGQLGAPFAAAARRRQERAEMMSDVIELATFGTPEQWVRKYNSAA